MSRNINTKVPGTFTGQVTVGSVTIPTPHDPDILHALLQTYFEIKFA
jgi:hypothetical protein